MAITLQPLRVEAGWLVNYNQLYEVDPLPGNEHYFEGSSLLVLSNDARLKLIDVQWRPEQDLNGEYQIRVLNFVEHFNPKNNTFDKEVYWDNPFLTYTTKSRLKLVEKLEEFMRCLPVFHDPRITLKRGVVDELSESFCIELTTDGFSLELAKRILEQGSANIQNWALDSKEISREILLEFAEKGLTKSIRNKAKQTLNQKQYRI